MQASTSGLSLTSGWQTFALFMYAWRMAAESAFLSVKPSALLYFDHSSVCIKFGESDGEISTCITICTHLYGSAMAVAYCFLACMTITAGEHLFIYRQCGVRVAGRVGGVCGQQYSKHSKCRHMSLPPPS